MSVVQTANDFDLDRVVSSARVVIVDFWGPNCGKCKLMAPVLERLAEDHVDTITVVAVNVVDAPDSVDAYTVTTLPTVKVFVDGKVVETMTGALPQRVLTARLKSAVAPFGLTLSGPA